MPSQNDEYDPNCTCEICLREYRRRNTPHEVIVAEATREAQAEIERLRAALSKAMWHLKRYNQPDALAVIQAALERAL